jgi:hypothetical protein
MGPLFFTCPKTNQQAPTGIETDLQSLRGSWNAVLKLSCPHCGEIHEIAVHETFTDEAAHDPRYPVAPSGAARTGRQAV